MSFKPNKLIVKMFSIPDQVIKIISNIGIKTLAGANIFCNGFQKRNSSF